MKKLLFPFLIAAACLTACGDKTTAPADEAGLEPASQSAEAGDFAYVQVELVLSQCDLYQTEGVALQQKTEKAQKSWTQKEQNLQYQAAQLQEKYQKGLITTLNAQAEQKKIEEKFTAYQASAQKEAQALEEENYVFTNRMQDLIHRAVLEVNADRQYRMIFNANALLDADTLLDITPRVLETVNALYAQDKKEKK